QWEDEGTRGQIRKIFLTPSLDFGDDWKKAWHDCLTKIKKRKIAALSRDVEVAEGSGDIAQVRVLSLKILDLKKALTKHRNLLSDIEI
ncbi:MAG: hypothetical protein KDD48_07985, partial [Bdellovibrionales bacterium]|nr:hypothetical protein [Bdellovibrionales bacterium]